MKNSKTSPVLTKYSKCKACSTPGKNCIECTDCKNTYHPRCLIQIVGMCVDIEGGVHCCGSDVKLKRCECSEKDVLIGELKARLLSVNKRCLEMSIREMEIEGGDGREDLHGEEVAVDGGFGDAGSVRYDTLLLQLDNYQNILATQLSELTELLSRTNCNLEAMTQRNSVVLSRDISVLPELTHERIVQ